MVTWSWPGQGLDPELDNTCELLDLSDDDPNWRYIAQMNSGHGGGGAVVMERKIYVLGGDDTNVEVYDVDQGILMEYLHDYMIIFDIYRSVEHFT